MQAAFLGSVKKKQRKGCVRLMQTKDEGMSREKQYDPENIYRIMEGENIGTKFQKRYIL